MTLKEKYQKIKTAYQEMVGKSEFTVSIRKQYLDRFRKTWKWADHIQLDNATPEISQLFCDTLNFYGKPIATAIKKKAAEKQAENKATALANVDWNDTGKLRTVVDSLESYIELSENTEQLSKVEAFHFEASEDQIRITNGFSEVNRMIVDYLNKNSGLVQKKFVEFVQDWFKTETAKIQKEIDEAQGVIGS